MIARGIDMDYDVTISRSAGCSAFANATADKLRGCGLAHGMHATSRTYPPSGASRASGGYWGVFGWGMRGRLALPCGHAGRMSLLAAVAERQPYRNGRESGSCADGMSVNLTKYIRRRYIIRVVLCNKRLSSAQFCNGLVIVLQKGDLHRAA